MTKYEFDHWLRYRLSDLPPQEVERISVFYQDAIADRMEDGMTEDEAIYALGEPESLLEDIRASIPVFEAYEEARQEAEKPKNRRTALLAIGLVVAALCAVIPVGLLFVFNAAPRHNEIYWENIEPTDHVPIVEDAVTEHVFLMDEVDKIAVAVDSAPFVAEPSPDEHLHIHAAPSCYTIRFSEGAVYVERNPNYTDADQTIRLQIPMDTHDYHLTVDMEMGDVELYELAPQSLQVTLEMGNIWLHGVSARDGIELCTQVGGIYGSLRGAATDYTVEASVEAGTSNLGNSNLGPIRLWASVELGDIDVHFEG